MGRKKKVSIWPQEVIDVIKHEWLSGTSAAQISKLLLRKGHRYSRSAVLSKLDREGIRRGEAAGVAETNTEKKERIIQRVRAKRVPRRAAQKRLLSAALFSGQQCMPQEAQNLDYLRGTVPYGGVHPPHAEHLTLSDMLDKEEGRGSPRRCRWTTSHYDVRETTYCAVPLSAEHKGEYCPVHAYRLTQKPLVTDEMYGQIVATLSSTQNSAPIEEPA